HRWGYLVYEPDLIGPVASSGSAGRGGRLVVPALAQAPEQRSDRRFPEVRAAFFSQDAKTALFIERLAIWPIRNQHVVGIRDRQDAGLEWDLIPAQPARIAAAVEALVVGDDDLSLAPKAVDAGEDGLAEFGVPLDHDPFLGVERARLAQDRVGDADLADVVQQAGAG